MHWWQIDLSGLFIRFCERIGLIAQVQRVTPEAAQAQRLRALQTRTALQAMRQQLQQSAEAAQAEVERIFQSSIVTKGDATLDELFTKCMRRTAEPGAAASSPLYLKRPRLEGYARTIQKLLEQARQMVPRGS